MLTFLWDKNLKIQNKTFCTAPCSIGGQLDDLHGNRRNQPEKGSKNSIIFNYFQLKIQTQSQLARHPSSKDSEMVFCALPVADSIPLQIKWRIVIVIEGRKANTLAFFLWKFFSESLQHNLKEDHTTRHWIPKDLVHSDQIDFRQKERSVFKTNNFKTMKAVKNNKICP